MDKFKSMTLDDRINQMKEDYNTEWWRASKIDNYDLKNKVSRINYLVTSCWLQTTKKKIIEMPKQISKQ